MIALPARVEPAARGGGALVARAAELAHFDQALHSTQLRGVVLSGEAGAGRSRLAAGMVARAGPSRPTMWITGSRAMAAIPFGAFAQLLPRRDIGSAAALEIVRTVDAEARRRGSLVLGVDDLHLLDDASAALTHQLAVTGAAFVVTTVLAGEPLGEPVRTLMHDPVLDRIDVVPFDRGASAALLAELLGGTVDTHTAQRLWAMSRGNARYLRELVRVGTACGRLDQEHGLWVWRGEIVPDARLLQLVEHRMAGLTAQQRTAMELLAVGEHLPSAVFGELAGADVEHELGRRGLLATGQDGCVTSAHPLYGAATLAGIGPSRRRQLSARLAAARIEPAGVIRRARWQLESGSPVDPTLLRQAARAAIRGGEHALAERFARGAADPQAAVLLAAALLRQGRVDECRAALAAAHCHPVPATALTVDAACLAGTVAFWGCGDAPAALRLLGGAAALATARQRPRLQALRGLVQLFDGRPQEALTTAEAGTRDDTSLAQLRVLALAALGRTDAALANAGTEGGAWQAAVAVIHWFAGRFGAMEEHCLRAYEQALTAPGHNSRGVAACLLGRARLGTGALPAARDTLREAVAALRCGDRLGLLPLALAWLARVTALLGDLTEGRSIMAECDDRLAGSPTIFATDVVMSRAAIAAAGGEHSRARTLLLDAADDAAQRGLHPLELEAVHEAVRIGQPGLQPRLHLIATRIDSVLAPALLAHADALSGARGAPLDRCAAGFAELGLPLLAAEAAAEAAGAYAAAGRTGPAWAAWRRAQHWAQLCGAPDTPTLERAHQPPGSGRLTRREREVAGLARRGLPNAEIARLLVLSRRTVENHLSAIYHKTGISGRSELLLLDGP